MVAGLIDFFDAKDDVKTPKRLIQHFPHWEFPVPQFPHLQFACFREQGLSIKN